MSRGAVIGLLDDDLVVGVVAAQFQIADGTGHKFDDAIFAPELTCDLPRQYRCASDVSSVNRCK